jgi:hypothetical protein
MKHNKPRYFVMHLPDDEPARKEGFVFGVQILDADGFGELEGYIGFDEAELEIEGHPVPKAVIAAARRQRDGQGDYVDADGNSVSPF